MLMDKVVKGNIIMIMRDSEELWIKVAYVTRRKIYGNTLNNLVSRAYACGDRIAISSSEDIVDEY